MKFIIILISPFLLALHVNAQIKVKVKPKPLPMVIDTNKFMGVGIFKIGTDTSVLLTYASKAAKYVRDCDDSENLLYASQNPVVQLLRLHHNPSKTYDIVSLSTHPEVKEYFLTEYVVSDIHIENVRLKYFRNKLIELKCKGSASIESAMSDKYGKPKSEFTKKVYTCLYKITGITRELDGGDYTSSWENGGIYAYSFMWVRYNDHCEKTTDQSFQYGFNNPELKSWEIKNQFDSSKTEVKKNLKDF